MKPSFPVWTFLGAALLLSGCGQSSTPAAPKDPNARNTEGKTLLILAIEKGDKQAVTDLLAQGASVSEGFSGDQPIHFAARGGQKEIVEMLLAKGVDPKTKNSKDQTGLHLASTRAVAELFVSKGLDVSVPTTYREQPIHFASERGNVDVVEYLLSKGADAKARSRDMDIMPLNYASTKAVAAMLVSNNAPINGETNQWGRNTPPIWSAAWNGRTEVVQYLVEQGADINAKSYGGQTALQVATQKGHTDIVNILAGNGTDLSGQEGANLLHEAVSKNDLKLTEALLNKGIKPNEGTEAPMTVAAARGNKAMLELLASHGGDIRFGGNNGWTPLHAAAAGHFAPIVATILYQKYSGEDFKGCMEWLLAKGADAKAPGGYSKLTPLHVAAKNNFKPGAELLIAAGADVNAKAEFDSTPLHWAVINDAMEIAQLLLEKGANPNLPLDSRAAVVTTKQGEMPNPFGGGSDAGGKVPLSLASSAAMKALLTSHGATVPTGQTALEPPKKSPEEIEQEKIQLMIKQHNAHPQ